jgi:class 3 adenylate cyclase
MGVGKVDGELRERRLSAILIADIVGYSRLVGADEAGTLRAMNAHRRELIDPTIASHRGRFVRTTGDGLILEFASAVDAVRCAVDVQRGMAERNETVPPDKRIEYRIGINVGDIVSVGDDIYGDGVNIAARLEAMSEPGGIYVSRAVRDPVVDKLSFGFDDLGEVAAKNIARPIHVFRVRHDIEVARRRLPLPSSRRLAVIAAVVVLAVISAGVGLWFWSIRPSGEEAKNLSAFIGRWDGIWDNEPEATTSLTIASVGPTGQATGSYVFMSENPLKFAARIANNAISFGGLTFQLRPDGKMDGTRNAGGTLDTAVLTNFAAFSPGRWEGIWDNDPQSTTSLTIESVSPTGQATGSYVFKSGNPIRFVARIADSTVSFGRPDKFTFHLRPDGKMDATLNLAGRLHTAVLTNPAIFAPGRWDGIWNNDPQSTTSLTIESVSPTGEVTGSYAFRSGTPARFVARIADSTVGFGRSDKFTFKLRPDGKMEATRNIAGRLDTAILTRN